MREVISLAKLTKAGCQRRLQEAIKKCQAVYMSKHKGVVTTTDMAAIEKILYKCMNRIK